MALERKNTAMHFEPGFDPEFERMLQHHLKRGGAPVAACSGFDADTASAFLEDALGSAARTQFESHLAGCPACRRHVIELSRLFQPVPEVETAAAVVAAQPSRPVKAGWKTRLSEWFDLSAWQWDWQHSGLAAAAAVALIAAVAFPVWRLSLREQAMRANESVASNMNREGQPQSAPVDGRAESSSVPVSPTPLIIAGRATEETASSKIPSSSPEQELRLRAGSGAVPIPNVNAPPAPSMEDVARPKSEFVKGPMDSLTQTTLTSISIPMSFGEPPTRAAVLSKPAAAIPVVRESAGEPKESFAAGAMVAPSQVTPSPANMVEPPVGPSPEDNPMRARTAQNNERARAKAAELSAAKPSLLDRALAFAPRRKADREMKPQPAPIQDEGVRFITYRIRDRVFNFINGVWIDQNYKPETMKWRVTTLVRDSDEFNRVLKEEPRLKAFFDKESIIVVWQDKIYKVVPKKKAE